MCMRPAKLNAQILSWHVLNILWKTANSGFPAAVFTASSQSDYNIGGGLISNAQVEHLLS